MQTLFAASPPLLSPTKRPIRTCRPLPKNVPLLQQKASHSPAHQKPMRAFSSPSPKKLKPQKSEDFEMCSSGAVLVLAKKAKASGRLIVQNPLKKTGENWSQFRIAEEDVFCQRSQQKYRIRSRGRSYERTHATLTPLTAPEPCRMMASEQMERRAGLTCLQPWSLSMECEQLSDLF